MATINKNIPAPNVDHADWLAEMAKIEGSVNLRDYRAAGGADPRMFLIESARRISTAMQDKVLKVEMNSIDDERVNCYALSDEAKVFWNNGFEQGLSAQAILDGWKAMQSILEENKSE